jgi:cell division protein FtsL
MWILLVIAFAVGYSLIYSLNKEIKRLKEKIERQGQELHEALQQLEGLKRGDRQLLDALHHQQMMGKLGQMLKEMSSTA